jgi:hypothetical protein
VYNLINLPTKASGIHIWGEVRDTGEPDSPLEIYAHYEPNIKTHVCTIDAYSPEGRANQIALAIIALQIGAVALELYNKRIWGASYWACCTMANVSIIFGMGAGGGR